MIESHSLLEQGPNHKISPPPDKKVKEYKNVWLFFTDNDSNKSSSPIYMNTVTQPNYLQKDVEKNGNRGKFFSLNNSFKV